MAAWPIRRLKPMPGLDGLRRDLRVLRYVWRDLLHNPRRTLASLVGVTLGVGLFSGILFFMDGSGATLTERAIAPLPSTCSLSSTSAPGGGLRLSEQLSAPAALGAGAMATVTLTVTNGGSAAANEVVLSDTPPSPFAYVPGTTNVDGAAIPDIGGQSPLSHGAAGFGLNIGKLGPGASATSRTGSAPSRPWRMSVPFPCGQRLQP